MGLSSASRMDPDIQQPLLSANQNQRRIGASDSSCQASFSSVLPSCQANYLYDTYVANNNHQSHLTCQQHEPSASQHQDEASASKELVANRTFNSGTWCQVKSQENYLDCMPLASYNEATNLPAAQPHGGQFCETIYTGQTDYSYPIGYTRSNWPQCSPANEALHYNQYNYGYYGSSNQQENIQTKLAHYHSNQAHYFDQHDQRFNYSNTSDHYNPGSQANLELNYVQRTAPAAEPTHYVGDTRLAQVESQSNTWYPANVVLSTANVASAQSKASQTGERVNKDSPALELTQEDQQQVTKTKVLAKLECKIDDKPVSHLVQRTNQCAVCGRNYARPSTLKTHLRTHTNERPFKCDVCHKTFSQAANLTAHQRVHTGERPFSCPICSRQFSQSSSVITHLRTHSGERPYRCSMCSRTFSDSSTLTKHCRIHSGEKPYQCDYCPLNFSQSGNLSRHLKLHLLNANTSSTGTSNGCPSNQSPIYNDVDQSNNSQPDTVCVTLAPKRLHQKLQYD